MRNLFITLMLSLALSGCTENAMSKQFGGSQTISLPAGQKLINVTWKEADLWVLFRPMKDGETADKYYFKEKSNFGVFEGSITLVETE